jgi:DNA-binding protein Fis
LIVEALRRSDGNQSIAAQLIGISRQTLNRRLKSLSIQPDD